MIISQLCLHWYEAQRQALAADPDERRNAERRAVQGIAPNPLLVPTFNSQMGDAAATNGHYLRSPIDTSFHDLPAQDRELIRDRVIAVLAGDVPRDRLCAGDRVVWPGRARNVDVRHPERSLPSTMDFGHHALSFATFYESFVLSATQAPREPRCMWNVQGWTWLAEVDLRVVSERRLGLNREHAITKMLSTSSYWLFAANRLAATGPLIDLYTSARPLAATASPGSAIEFRISHNVPDLERAQAMLEILGGDLTLTICATGVQR